MKTRYACLLALAPFCATPAFAQSTSQITMAHTMASNQLGVLEYCHAQGDVPSSVVTTEQANVNQLPGADTVADKAAEEKGKGGTVAAGTNDMTLASMASTHNTTVSALCKQMGDSVTQTASMMKQNGMPSMPNGMSVPNGMSIPSGMSMPSAPSGTQTP